MGLLDTVAATLAGAVQEQDDRESGGSGGLNAGRNEHLVVSGLAVHLHCAGLEATARAVRQRGATAHHQKASSGSQRDIERTMGFPGAAGSAAS
jgi:predicted enzyme related to lactoylglutathione lyase